MNDTVLAALITGAATLIVGLIGGASAAYLALRRQKEQKETALEALHQQKETAQSREEEARLQAEQAHRREAAAYLKSIADIIEQMRDEIAESQIPRKSGHQFTGLLGSYKGFLQPYLGNKTQDELENLTLRVQKVVTEKIDPTLKAGREVDQKTLDELLADMDRIEGDVRAQATRISPTESRAN